MVLSMVSIFFKSVVFIFITKPTSIRRFRIKKYIKNLSLIFVREVKIIMDTKINIHMNIKIKKIGLFFLSKFLDDFCVKKMSFVGIFFCTILRT